MAKSPPALISVRFRQLLLQLIKEENGNVAAAGRRLGLSQPHAKAIVDGTRHAKMETIEKAQQRLPVATQFFVDRSLGAAPDYRELLEQAGKRAPRAPKTATSDAGASFEEPEATFKEVLEALVQADATSSERDLVISQLQSRAPSRNISVDYVLGVLDTSRSMLREHASRRKRSSAGARRKARRSPPR